MTGNSRFNSGRRGRGFESRHLDKEKQGFRGFRNPCFFICSTFGSTCSKLCSKLLYLCFRNTSLRLFPVDTDFKGILGVSVDIFGEYFGIGDCFSVYTS